MSYKRHQLNLYDQADASQEFSISHQAGVVNFSVPAAQLLQMSGKSQFVGTDTYVSRETGGVSEYKTLEVLFDDIDTGLSTLTTNLASEVTRATNAETTLDNKIDSEIANLTTIDANHHASALAAVAAEQVRATGAEGTIQSNLDTEVARAIAAETILTTDLAAQVAKQAADKAASDAALAAEVTRATDAENAIQADVDANEAAALAARNAMQTTLQANINTVAANLVAEEGRATTAEAGLQSQIDNIVSNADPAALDSLTEIVAHFNAADSNASNILGLLIYRVQQIQNVVNTLLEPDLADFSATLSGASVTPP